MTRIKRSSTPPSPGEVFRQRLLDETDLTQAQVARALSISRPRLNMLLKGRCQLSADIALRIEKVFGISPEFWMRVRGDFEIAEARNRMCAMLNQLTPIGSRRQTASAWLVDEAWQVAA
jgi:addiction module HigA family antidote